MLLVMSVELDKSCPMLSIPYVEGDTEYVLDKQHEVTSCQQHQTMLFQPHETMSCHYHYFHYALSFFYYVGEWQDGLTYGTVYQAQTDRFVSALIRIGQSDAEGYLFGYTASNNPPVTIRGYASVSHAGSQVVDYNSFLMPIKKGDYWKVDFTDMHLPNFCIVQISWMPLGT